MRASATHPPANSRPPACTADIEALAGYAPRQAALDWIKEGKADTYLDWANGDGNLAAWGDLGPDLPFYRPVSEATPLPLDDALWLRLRDCATAAGHDWMSPFSRRLYSLACEKIPSLGASPLEVAIRRASLPAVFKLLQSLTRPERVFERGYDGEVGKGWTSPAFRTRAHDPVIAVDLPLLSSGFDQAAALLAILCGQRPIAEECIRHGWSPHAAHEWSHLARLVSTTRLAIAANPALDPIFNELFDLPGGTLEFAEAWLNERAALAAQLDDLFERNPDAAWYRELESLLARAAPVDYYPLAVASEWMDKGLLEQLFAAGANPNCTYKTGVSLLARLDATRLKAPVLQVWLDHGANPTHGSGSSASYGDEWNPSALYQWVWEGKLDLVRQAVEQSRGGVPLWFMDDDDGRRCSPMVDLARARGHPKLANWMSGAAGASQG